MLKQIPNRAKHYLFEIGIPSPELIEVMTIPADRFWAFVARDINMVSLVFNRMASIANTDSTKPILMIFTSTKPQRIETRFACEWDIKPTIG